MTTALQMVDVHAFKDQELRNVFLLVPYSHGTCCKSHVFYTDMSLMAFFLHVQPKYGTEV